MKYLMNYLDVLNDSVYFVSFMVRAKVCSNGLHKEEWAG